MTGYEECIGIRPGELQMQPGEDFQQLLLNLRGRETTRASDEAICLATLLGQGLEEVLSVPDDQKWIQFLRILSEHQFLCPDMIFLPGKKLTEPGFRWAFKSLLEARNPMILLLFTSDYDPMVNAYELATSTQIRNGAGHGSTDPGGVRVEPAILTDKGLHVFFPSFRIIPRESYVVPQFIYKDIITGTSYIIDAAHERSRYTAAQLENWWDSVKPPPRSQVAVILRNDFERFDTSWALLVRVLTGHDDDPIRCEAISTARVSVYNNPIMHRDVVWSAKKRGSSLRLPVFNGVFMPDRQEWCIG